ncbi:MAG: GNAT family N-acetyltransferase [Azospirillaceae bacterium]|nr:GNAT family N-acetyltransferase [Azospirillaceae bacterium]
MNEPIIDEIPGSDAELVATLVEASLPIDDLDEPNRRFFRFRGPNSLIGFIGWEEVDEGSVLLHALVVAAPHRDRGLGTLMTNWALTRLRALGVGNVYALTMTAETLLIRLGFVRIDRGEAPPSLRRTCQFAGLCPASATLLHRSLP